MLYTIHIHTHVFTPQSEMVKIVIWLLKHRLLIQLHDYLYLKPSYCEITTSADGKRG